MAEALFVIPPLFDPSAAEALRGDLLISLNSHRSVSLDASQVDRVGTSGLQVLCAAALGFRKADLAFTIRDPNTVFQTAVAEAALTSILDVQSDGDFQ